MMCMKKVEDKDPFRFKICKPPVNELMSGAMTVRCALMMGTELSPS